MAPLLPQPTDKLNNPSHSLLHRIISVDGDAPEGSVEVNDLGEISATNLSGENTGDQDLSGYALSCINQYSVTDYTFTGAEIRNSGYAVITTTGNKTININADLFSTGFEVTICKWTDDTNTVTVDAQTGNTIDGSQTYVLTKHNETITIVKDGANTWKVKNSHIGKASDYVPYTGATTDVDLGLFDLTATDITGKSINQLKTFTGTTTEENTQVNKWETTLDGTISTDYYVHRTYLNTLNLIMQEQDDGESMESSGIILDTNHIENSNSSVNRTIYAGSTNNRASITNAKNGYYIYNNQIQNNKFITPSEYVFPSGFPVAELYAGGSFSVVGIANQMEHEIDVYGGDVDYTFIGNDNAVSGYFVDYSDGASTISGTIYGVKNNLFNFGNGDANAYSFYSNIQSSITGEAWNLYVEGIGDNFMGGDNQKTYWGTAKDFALYSDSIDLRTDGAFKPEKMHTTTFTADGTTLGSEMLTNGTFTGSATGWALPTGWAYNTNLVRKNADGTDALTQALGSMVTQFEVGQTYSLTYTISTRTVGSVTPSVAGVTLTTRSANGTYTEVFTAVSNTALAFTPTNTARFYIDTISVKVATDGDLNVEGYLDARQAFFGGETNYSHFEEDGSLRPYGSAKYKSSDGSAGVSGTFTTVDLKTVTVKDGLIISIV